MEMGWKRMGTMLDEMALCQTFTNFGFDTQCDRDLRLEDIRRRVRECKSQTTALEDSIKILKIYFFFTIVSRRDFSSYSCVVISVLSHGDTNEMIRAYDGEYHLRGMLVEPIASNRSLAGKPKIFIIAACKGSNRVRLDRDSAATENRVPLMRDILICYSTYEGMYIYGHSYILSS